jgi:WD40 repeat protein
MLTHEPCKIGDLILKSISSYARPYARRTCLFSIKFSRNGSEILAGSNDDAIYIYDLGKGERILRVRKIGGRLLFSRSQFDARSYEDMRMM